MRWYHRRVDPNSGERYYEHRAIAEWKVGRPLRPGEVVHHLNNDPRDNHPDNLLVLPNQREAAGSRLDIIGKLVLDSSVNFVLRRLI